MYSYNSVTLADISSPNSFKPLDALWSMPKHVPIISQVRSHCPHAIEKLRGKVTMLGADRILMSSRDRAPVPEATMAYQSAWPRRNFLAVDVCWLRTKG